MTAHRRAALVPAVVTWICLAIAAATTAWSAKPLYGPLRDEFGWTPAVLGPALVASLALTGALAQPLSRTVRWVGIRAATCAGTLGCGLLMILALPNLTHLWQVCVVLVTLGPCRALIAAGAWRAQRRALPALWALAAAAGAPLFGLVAVTPWIAQVVYRNSWREGAAACGGLLLVVASPLAYVLLPGAELEAV